MRQILLLVLVLAIAIGTLGYWRGWFAAGGGGKIALEFDSEKFKADKAAFSKSVGERATAARERVVGLWSKSEAMTGDEKSRARVDLLELNKKHERIEQQIQDLDESGESRFESIKQDLTASLDEVEKKAEALTKKLANGADK